MKAWEYYVDHGLDGVDYVEGLQWLREHIVAGSIRVKFDGIEITPRIAELLLEHRDLKFPEERDQPPLPPDFALNRSDIQHQLKQRHRGRAPRLGRPRRAGSLADADRELVYRMNQMISSFGTEAEYRRIHGREPPWPSFPSPTAAARYLVEAGEVPGAGTPDSKIRRLVRRYHQTYGDDR